MKFVHDGAELGREHNLTHLHPSKGFRFKCVSLIFKCVILSSSTELVSNIKFISSLLIQEVKLDSGKFFLSLNLINMFTGNVKK